MAYFKKEKLFQQALDVCKKGGCTCIEDIVALLPCSKPTFYKMFPVDGEAMEAIKDALAVSKRKALVSIRSKLYNSKNPTALLAVYRMLCTPEERDAISTSKTDITTNGKDINQEPLTIEIIDKREQIEEIDE